MHEGVVENSVLRTLQRVLGVLGFAGPDLLGVRVCG